MPLNDKNAIVYGAAGAVGSAVTRAFAREGARVHLTGRRLGALEALATDINASGGEAEAAEVDALDEAAVAEHLDAVAGGARAVRPGARSAVGRPTGVVAHRPQRASSRRA